eukprot:9686115-Lingulodinium_polyedra.AAC.1
MPSRGPSGGSLTCPACQDSGPMGLFLETSFGLTCTSLRASLGSCFKWSSRGLWVLTIRPSRYSTVATKGGHLLRTTKKSMVLPLASVGGCTGC